MRLGDGRLGSKMVSERNLCESSILWPRLCKHQTLLNLREIKLNKDELQEKFSPKDSFFKYILM